MAPGAIVVHPVRLHPVPERKAEASPARKPRLLSMLSRAIWVVSSGSSSPSNARMHRITCSPKSPSCSRATQRLLCQVPPESQHLVQPGPGTTLSVLQRHSQQLTRLYAIGLQSGDDHMVMQLDAERGCDLLQLSRHFEIMVRRNGFALRMVVDYDEACGIVDQTLPYDFPGVEGRSIHGAFRNDCMMQQPVAIAEVERHQAFALFRHRAVPRANCITSWEEETLLFRSTFCFQISLDTGADYGKKELKPVVLIPSISSNLSTG